MSPHIISVIRLARQLAALKSGPDALVVRSNTKALVIVNPRSKALMVIRPTTLISSPYIPSAPARRCLDRYCAEGGCAGYCRLK